MCIILTGDCIAIANVKSTKLEEDLWCFYDGKLLSNNVTDVDDKLQLCGNHVGIPIRVRTGLGYNIQ